ncbi:DUF2752 domain-containing protein [Leptospira sarikeiensis]|nr:DUF2752 domain-containing protein [Leptospira sarikeiensis]
MWDLLQNPLKILLIQEVGPSRGSASYLNIYFISKVFLSLFLFLLISISIASVFPLDTESEHWFTICWWKHLTGWDCPGCGLSRAVICFFRGDFSRSWNYHPFGIPISILGTVGFLIRLNFGKQVWGKILENHYVGFFSCIGIIGIFVWYCFKHFF